MLMAFACSSYLMMLSKTSRMQEQDIFRIYQVCLELVGKHTNTDAGEMALPMMMTQDNHVLDYTALKLGK